jgi:hypothetical protein
MAEVKPKPQTRAKEQPQKIVDDHEEDYITAPLKAGQLPDDVVETLKKFLS